MASVHKLRILFTQSAPGFPAIAVMRLSGEHGAAPAESMMAKLVSAMTHRTTL